MSYVDPALEVQRAFSNFTKILVSLPVPQQEVVLGAIRNTLSNALYSQEQTVLEQIMKAMKNATPVSVDELPKLVEQTQSIVRKLPGLLSVYGGQTNLEPLVLAMNAGLKHIKTNILPRIITLGSGSAVNTEPAVVSLGSSTVNTQPGVVKLNG